MLKIGLDIDGVLANFAEAYQRMFVEVGRHDLFLPGDVEDPPIWDWPEFRGYTDKEAKEVWRRIKAHPTFWQSLDPLPGMKDLVNAGTRLADDHIYFITARAGSPKHETETWLVRRWLWLPTVIMTNKKGAVACAIGLDAFLDDNYDNAVQIATESPKTRSYLLSRRYNSLSDMSDTRVQRVNTVEEFLRANGR